MSSSIVASDADSLMLGLLRDIRSRGRQVSGVIDPRSIASGFGRAQRATRELVAHTAMLAHPRRRLVTLRARKMRLGYAIGNLLWTLQGSSSPDFIELYTPNVARFTENGDLLGSTGARIGGNSDGASQLGAVVELLRRDPSSRRGVVMVMRPSDVHTLPLDTPCTVALQFMLREGALEAITIMRSQSAAMILPYDLFLFTSIHEILASELGVPLGPYYQFFGSLHYYEDEAPLVEELLSNEVSTGRVAQEMQAMPPQSLGQIPTILKGESVLRKWIEVSRDHADRATVSIDAVVAAWEQIGLHPYWRALLAAICGEVIHSRGYTIPAEVRALISDETLLDLLDRNR